MKTRVTKYNTGAYEKKRIKKQVFEEYILWLSLPETERIKTGIETQTDFSNKFKVGQQTLSVWNSDLFLQDRVRYIRNQWAFNKTGTVIQAIYRSAVKGNPLSQKLWMQVFEGFTEKTQQEQIKKVELGINDIRFLIDGLPTDLKEKCYEHLRAIIEITSEARHTGAVETEYWEERPPQAIPGETDNDAQDIQVQRGYEMASGHQESVCEDMEWEISSCDNQSTSWRWKK